MLAKRGTINFRAARGRIAAHVFTRRSKRLRLRTAATTPCRNFLRKARTSQKLAAQ